MKQDITFVIETERANGDAFELLANIQKYKKTIPCLYLESVMPAEKSYNEFNIRVFVQYDHDAKKFAKWLNEYRNNKGIVYNFYTELETAE
jgi:ribosome-associated toxin RatA of RatAB toxin-antitoxin module